MSVSVKYVLTDPARLPHGPVALRIRPDGQIIAAVDKTQIDPVIAPALGGLGGALLEPYKQLDGPQETPVLKCRICISRFVSGSRLLAVEVSRQALEVIVADGLMTKDLARHLGIAATSLMRHFTL